MLFKKITALTIAYSFMLQLGSQFGLWVNFMANPSNALSHCENKNTVEMKCYGNCVLVKEIKALEKNQSKDNNIQLKVTEFQLFSPTVFDVQYFSSKLKKENLWKYMQINFSSFFLPIFQPPD